jgi:hypothetical protein
MKLDTLSFSDRLQEAGVPRKEAEAHAQLARDVIFEALVEKEKFQGEVDRIARDITALERRLEQRLTELELRIVVKLGAIVAGAVAILVAVQKLL